MSVARGSTPAPTVLLARTSHRVSLVVLAGLESGVCGFPTRTKSHRTDAHRLGAQRRVQVTCLDKVPSVFTMCPRRGTSAYCFPFQELAVGFLLCVELAGWESGVPRCLEEVDVLGLLTLTFLLSCSYDFDVVTCAVLLWVCVILSVFAHSCGVRFPCCLPTVPRGA